MLSISHQAMLKHASKTHGTTAEKIAAIDYAVEQIKREAPDKFHDDKSLKERVFFHQPFLLELKEYSHAIYKTSPYGLLK